MDFTTYSSKFTNKALKLGLTNLEIDECLNYSKKIFEANLPIIYNTSHFSKLVGVRKTYIKRAAIYTKSYYRNFEIAKKNGNPRLISEPLPNLKSIQDFILKEILSNVKVSAFAKAYKKKSSIIENTRYHINQSIVLSLDIEDFFGSIKREKIEKIFLMLGYSELLSDLFSKLCTLNDSLPQGAPTSPFLSNIIMKEFDSKIADYCLENKIRYTRYADDITLSGNFNVKEAEKLVTSELLKLDLKLNTDKTKIMTPNMRQIVTGIVVNQKNQVPRNERMILRQSMYYIKKFGLEEHIKAKNISYNNYLYYLYGKIAYIVYINPEDKEFIEYKNDLKGLIKKKNQ